MDIRLRTYFKDEVGTVPLVAASIKLKISSANFKDMIVHVFQLKKMNYLVSLLVTPQMFKGMIMGQKLESEMNVL